jgi:hypothetical protein
MVLLAVWLPREVDTNPVPSVMPLKTLTEIRAMASSDGSDWSVWRQFVPGGGEIGLGRLGISK